MSRTMNWLPFALAAAVLCFACEKTDDEKKPEAVTAAAAGGAAPMSNTGSMNPVGTAPVTLADEDLPVSADYEDEAKVAITPANYKAEVAALESEISAEQ